MFGTGQQAIFQKTRIDQRFSEVWAGWREGTDTVSKIGHDDVHAGHSNPLQFPLGKFREAARTMPGFIEFHRLGRRLNRCDLFHRRLWRSNLDCRRPFASFAGSLLAKIITDHHPAHTATTTLRPILGRLNIHQRIGDTLTIERGPDLGPDTGDVGVDLTHSPFGTAAGAVL